MLSQDNYNTKDESELASYGYRETAAARTPKRYEKEVEDPRLFPFSGANARIMWNTALENAKFNGRDRNTNIHKIHPHVLRKFFRTKLGAVIPVDVVEALMGHEGYLTEVYRRYTVKDLAKFYKQGEHVLQVFSEAEEVSKLREEIEEKSKQLQTLVNGLATENVKLKTEIEKLHEFVDKELNASKKQVEQLKQMIEAGEPEPSWYKGFKQFMAEYLTLETRKVQSEGYKDLKDYFRAIGAQTAKVQKTRKEDKKA